MESFAIIQGSAKSKATLDNYKWREGIFLKWLRETHPECWMNPEIVDESSLLTRITTTMLCSFIDIHSRNKDGTMKSHSTPEGYRSMLVHLFKKQKMKLPETFKNEWIDYSKGFKNISAKNIAAGLTPSAGSDKLPFEDYKLLTGIASKSETFYAHGFLVLA